MQLRQGEDARLVITTSTGAPFLQYEVSDIIEPLFPGETSVFWIQDHSNAAKPTSLLHDRRFVDKIEIYKSKLDPKHAYYINYAWLL